MKAARRHHRSTSTRTTRLTRRVRLLFVSALFLFSVLAALYFVQPPPAEAVSTSIVISQVYGGGGNSGAPYKNDFIELHNLGTTTINLSGWSVQYASTGSGSWSVTTLSGSLAPGRYYLVQEGSGGSNGVVLPAPSKSGTIAMSATDGKVALVNSTTPLTGICPSSASIVDFVGYGNGPASGDITDCSEGSPAPTLSNSTADIRKNGGNQDTDNNSADFTAATPFPRSGVFNASSSIAPDSASHSCQFFSLTAGPTLNWMHAIGSGTNRLLMVGISTYTTTADPAPRVLSVTYNGTPLTRVDDTLARDSGNQTQVEMFRLLESQMPATPGNYTITATLTIPGATSTYAVGGSVSFSGVDQTTPFNTGQTAPSTTFAKNTGTGTSPTVTVASGSNEYVMDTVSSVYTGTGGAALTANNPLQMEQWNGKNGDCFGTSVLDSIGAGSTRPGASPSVSMAWTLATSQPWAIGAVSIRPASTLVELASFEAAQTGSGVALQWRTGYEVNNLGFNLYRERNGKRVRVNPSIIAGSAFLVGPGTALNAGDSYSWFDPQGTSDAVYYLEDVDLNGTSKVSNPVAPSLSASSMKAGRSQALLLSELNAQAASTSTISKWQNGWPAITGPGRETLYHIDNKPGSDLQSLIAAHGAMKISVKREGWYRVTQADLAAAGFNENVDARLLQLYEGSVQVPILMKAATQQFSPGDSFEFYGMGLDTPTTDTNTYWLVIGNGKKSLRISAVSPASTSAKTDPPIALFPSSQPRNSVAQPQAVQLAATTVRTSTPQVNWQDWFVLPMIITPAKKADAVEPDRVTSPSFKKDESSIRGEMTESEVVKPEREVESTNNVAAPTATTPVKTSEPVKKSEDSTAPPRKTKKKARAKGARLKAASHSHAMLSQTASQSYPYTVELKERLIYISSLINGETENFYGKVIGASPVSQTLILENLGQSSTGTSQLEVALQGYTQVSHQVKVKVNGQEVGSLSFKGQEHAVTQLTVPSTALLEGENTIVLERAGGETDVSLVDYLRLTYDHSYQSDGNLLRFTADASARLDGFANSNIRVMDISDPLRIKEVASRIETSTNGYAATIQAPGEGEYIAFTDEGINHPAKIERDHPSNLKSSDNAADLVVITYGDFMGSVQPLVDLRRRQGMAVAVIDVQDVYDEFGYGAHGPNAIKDFLSWAKSHWQKSPKFVLLVGDASLDPRNYLGTGEADFVPTKLVDASSMETASDGWLADFNGDGIPEMAVGRLPVRTKAEADQVVAKITGYVPGNTQQQVLMVVDKNNAGDNFSFAQTGAELGTLLPPSIGMNTISRADNSDDSALHSQIVNAINQGPLMVNYVGHGSVEVWTGAPILITSDVNTLNNSNHLPVFVMMTCLNGYFPNPSRESLAEALLRDNANGAVAVWASSGMTEPNAQAQMNKQFYQSIFSADGATLGEAMQSAQENVGNEDVRRTWIFFGDPTMRIR